MLDREFTTRGGANNTVSSHTNCRVLKQAAQDKWPLIIAALAKGLGKTPIGLAVLDILRLTQGQYEIGDNLFGPAKIDGLLDEIDWRASPNFNLERLAKMHPVVRHGLSMVIAPQLMLGQWTQEYVKFKSNNRMKMVVLHLAKWGPADMQKYKGCCHWPTGVVLRADGPPMAQLRAAFPETDLQNWKKHGKISIIRLLEPSKDGTAQSWQKDWVVSATEDPVKHTRSIDPSTGVRSPTEGGLNAIWSIVLIDEFDLWKNLGVKPWSKVGGLPGHPFIAAQNATPYTRARDTATISITAHAKYFIYESTKNKAQTLFKSAPSLNPGDSLKGEESDKMFFLDGLSNKQVDVIRGSSYLDVDQNAGPVDKYIDSGSLNDASRGRQIPRRRDIDEIKEHLQQFGAWLEGQIIPLDADLDWQHDIDQPGLAAIEIPPHAAFDVHFDLNISQHAKRLRRHWDSCRDVDAPFFSSINELKLYILFPSILYLRLHRQRITDHGRRLSSTG